MPKLYTLTFNQQQLNLIQQSLAVAKEHDPKAIEVFNEDGDDVAEKLFDDLDYITSSVELANIDTVLDLSE